MSSFPPFQSEYINKTRTFLLGTWTFIVSSKQTAVFHNMMLKKLPNKIIFPPLNLLLYTKLPTMLTLQLLVSLTPPVFKKAVVLAIYVGHICLFLSE